MAILTDQIEADSEPPQKGSRMMDAGSIGEDQIIERALRPKQLDEYIGQSKVREQLEIFITAAKSRSEALDHV